MATWLPSCEPSLPIEPFETFTVFHHPPPVLATIRHTASSLLFELYNLQAVLKDSWKIPKDLLEVIESASSGVDKARKNYQSTFAAPREVRDAARQQLFAANAALNTSVMEAEHLFLERQEIWDRIVRLLRGDSFFAPYSMFEPDPYHPPKMVTLPFVGPPQFSGFW